MKSKRAKACEFTHKTRQIIAERDGGTCIFCKIGYRMDKAEKFALEIKDFMHYVPRSQGGLGIEQNAAVGCRYHHSMLDNGVDGCRKEMMEVFKKYLMQQYPGWNERTLVYDKRRMADE